MPNQPVETKGANILAALDVLKTRLGAERMATILAGLPGEAGQRLRGDGLSRIGWYPVEWYGQLLQSTQQACFEAPTLMRETGLALVQRDLGGIYSVLVKVISPAMIVSWGPRTFGQYYRGGTLEVTTIGQGAAQAIYTGWHGFNRSIWQTVAGGSQAAVTACGGKQVRTDFMTGGIEDSARLGIFWTR